MYLYSNQRPPPTVNMSSALTVSYNLRVPDSAASSVPAQDRLSFDLPSASLSDLSKSIRAARESMNGILTTWKDSVDEKVAEAEAEKAWMQEREQEEKRLFEKGVADEDDQEERVQAEDQP